jgi:hypothetical protein
MLDKTTIELIYLLKSKDNTMYNVDDVEYRIRHFITDTYRYDNITDNRILIELENAFLEAVENINKKSLKYFVSEFLRMQKANGSEYAYITSLRLLGVKDESGYINGFYDITENKGEGQNGEHRAF